MRLSTTRRAAWTAAAVLVAMAAAVVGTAEARRPKVDPRMYDVHKKAFGKSFPDWTAEWWQWVESIPNSVSPWLDLTGASVEIGQHGPVWFLCGTAGAQPVDPPHRVATIPSGKALLVPVWNVISDNVGVVPPLSVAGLREAAAGALVNVDVNQLAVVLDGSAIQGLRNTRVVSSEFSYWLPPGSFNEVASQGVYVRGIYAPTVSDGYWVMLKPLAIGHHTLSVTTQYGTYDYDLTVVDHDKP